MFGKRKAHVINLSPSHKMIRDFKKSEISKSGSSPNCTDKTNVFKTEWTVLYTTQITKKAKKFHDGFLELLVRGVHGRQVKLYDTNRKQLDSRFLKKDEKVCSGESLAFDGHLVEIWEQEGYDKPPTEIPHRENSKIIGRTSAAARPDLIITNKKFPAGKPPDSISLKKLSNLNDSSSKSENAKLNRANADPKRSVHDILSMLKQPSERKSDPRIKPVMPDPLESHSSEELRADNDLASSSSIFLRDVNEMSNSSSLESHLTFNFEDQMPIESETLTRSIKIEEPENTTKMYSETLTRPIKIEEPESPTKMSPHEVVTSKANAAAMIDMISSQPPELGNGSNSGRTTSHASTVASDDCTSLDITGVKETTFEKKIHIAELNEFPSFDLGF